MARLNASLGVSLNSTPIEDKKESHLKPDKSPLGGRNNLRASNLNRSLNKSLNNQNKLNSSIPLSDTQRRIGGVTRNKDRNSTLSSIQSTANLAKKQIDPSGTPSRRKESSVNRKLERISSSNRQQNDLDTQLDKEITKIKQKNSDEVVPEILLLEEDNTMELDENLDNVGKSIKQLKYGDLSGKVDALVIINELITKKLDEASESLIRNSNFLIDSISKVLYDVFNKTPDKVPLKFGKYFISIVNKVCSIKEIMRNVEEKRILILVEQLLLKLLIPGLDTLGERNEGQAMFRNLNNTILRVLENCHPTQVFVVFLNLLKKYKGYSKIEKLNGIIVKCLLKVTRIMDQLIDKINIERILLATHEYLLTKPANSSAKADEVGIRITKTIVNELVKIKRDEIWEYYGGVDAHMTQDVYIKKWIEIILMSLSGGEGVQRPKTASDARTGEYTGGLSSEDNEQIKSIIQETQWGNQFRADQAFKSLVEFTNDFPTLDLDAYLKANYSSEVYNNILIGIMKAKRRKQLAGRSAKNVTSNSFKAPMSGGLKTPNKFTSSMNENNEDSSQRLSAISSKMQGLQNKYADGSQNNEDSESASSSLRPDADNKLGKSIAAMNSSITEKWKRINSRGLKPVGGLNNTVGGGFKANALQDKSTLDKDSNENEPEADANRSAKTKQALQARLNEVKARLGQIRGSGKNF